MRLVVVNNLNAILTKLGFIVVIIKENPLKICNTKLFIKPIKNDAILAYHWSMKMYTGLPLVILSV